MTGINAFDSYGYPTSISHGPTAQRIAYNYTWNATTQNLTSRSMVGYTENFTYDAADRLTNWTVNSAAYTANYSGNGNPDNYRERKSDFGLYAYNSSKPHAVSNISSLIAGTGEERTCEAEYNTIGKIKKLTLKNGSTTLKTATFTYAADGQRRKMVVGSTTTIYCDDYQVNKTGSTEQRLHYISGPAGLCALIVQNYSNGSLASRATYYLQTDYQGSIIAAYNSNGTLYKRFAYDPWGRRRNGSNWTNYQTDTETLITRGYCGHEHLDDFGTINMNGRIYDPRLGRFLSPDPYVQAPYNSQNYNRYSYCLNNPLKYTDPDGEWILTWGFWGKGFSIGLNFAPYPFGVGINVDWSDGLSIGVYGEVGYRVGGTGLGAGVYADQGFSYNLTNKDKRWNTFASEGIYASAGPFTIGGSLNQNYNITEKDYNSGWNVSAGLGWGSNFNYVPTEFDNKGPTKGYRSQWGLGLGVSYGSDGFGWSFNGNYERVKTHYKSCALYMDSKENTRVEGIEYWEDKNPDYIKDNLSTQMPKDVIEMTIPIPDNVVISKYIISNKDYCVSVFDKSMTITAGNNPSDARITVYARQAIPNCPRWLILWKTRKIRHF